MLFSLPDHPTLYAALLQRSHDYEGRAYVGVTSTGILSLNVRVSQAKVRKLQVLWLCG